MRPSGRYDVIVVGARCAGASTAMLLARQGLRVLLVDRARFPSDTLSSHYLQQAGARILHRWGLYGRLAATGCPPVREMNLDFGTFALNGFSPGGQLGALADFCPRRRVLDSLLVEAAVEAGVELRTGFAVRELVSDAHGVSGIVGQGERGIVCREPASLVVGADGMRSLVARAVQAPVYDAYPPLTCNYFSYFAGVPIHRAELFSRPGLFVIASPTHEGLTQVIVIRPRGEFRPLRTLTDAQFLAFLEGLPRLSELVRGGRRVERFYGTADLPFYFRKPYGPGWALAGDAGHFKDPITAQGMTNAFQQAILLAEAALSIFNGHQSFDEAMREYEFTRNAETRSMYDFTRELAKLHSPPPDVERILRATSERPGTADQFFGILGGSVSKEEFFASASANTEGVLHRASRGQRLPCPGGPRPARHF